MQTKLAGDITLQSCELAKKFIEFNNQAVSPYHATQKLEEKLVNAGFHKLNETEVWDLKNGEFYYLKRGYNSSLIAFGIPCKGINPTSTGFKMVGGHMDSPCIRVAPKFDGNCSGFEQVHIQTYGGGIWHTWLDRDLVLGGRVVIRTNKGLETKLYRSRKAVAKIPSLAIHLTQDRETLKLNKETDLKPLIATQLMKNLHKSDKSPASVIKGLICSNLGCLEEEIIDFDLCFGDANCTDTIGAYEEFISGPRLDSLFAAYSIIESLIDFKINAFKYENSTDVNLVGIFNHEEIGSKSYDGADSEFMSSVISAIIDGTGNTKHSDLGIILRRSFLLSTDMAHSVHPNYAELHQINHQPKLNGGVVLKYNCNLRFSTDGISGALGKYIAKKFDIPLTDYMIRQDSPCGSTLGPLLASKLGCLSMDIGVSQLGMHSCRETAGVLDFYYYTQFLNGYFTTGLNEMMPQTI